MDSAGIVSKDGEVKTFMNGGLASTISEYTYTEPGYLASRWNAGRWPPATFASDPSRAASREHTSGRRA
jgi:hypothetical protein